MKTQAIPKFPTAFLSQVRTACKHYHHDSRLSLLPLASLAVQAMLANAQSANHATDVQGRANALRHVLDSCLQEMKPQQAISREGEIYLCLYSHIHKRDPYTNRTISDVVSYLEAHSDLPIPQATYYYRLKKEGFPSLCYLLSTLLAQQTTWIEPVPYKRPLVGRNEEHAYYRAQLERGQVAVIEGVEGVGKTVLGAQVANSLNRPICWLTLRAGLNDSPTGLLYAWAAFLAQHNYPQLWAFMRATANFDAQLTDYYPLLRQGLAQVQPILCVDNLEILSDEAGIGEGQGGKGAKGCWSLLEIVQKVPGTRLLLISQRRPPLANLGDYPRLGGLLPCEVQEFMQHSHQLPLSPKEAETVTRYTLGNPRLLELWAASVHLQKLDMPASLAQLHDSKAATQLLTKIMAILPASTTRAAYLLALSRHPLDSFLLQNPPIELEALSDLGIQNEDFNRLRQFGLIDKTSSEQWSLSPLLQDYLLGHLSTLGEEILLHQWLSHLYSLQGNVLEAAYHAIHGEEAEQAILLLAEQQHLLIEQGLAPAMQSLLSGIQSDQMSKPVRQLLRELRIELGKLLGDYAFAEREARAAAQEAITATTQARAEQLRGELAKQRGKIGLAADHYHHALRLLATKEASLEAWLHRDLAWVLAEQNDIEEAWDEAQRARIALENTLGIIARRRGELDLALQHLEEGARIAEEYGEQRTLTRLRNNIALIYLAKKQYQRAISLYQQNLTLIHEIGELVGQAITLMNLGNCYGELGASEEAIEHLNQALPIFETLGDSKGLLLVHINLAEQQLQLNEVDHALKHAQIAISYPKNLIPTTAYAYALRIYAEILLAQDQKRAALTAALKAYDTLRTRQNPEQFSDPHYAKLICQTLARIYNACDEPREAENYQMLAERLAR